MVWMGEADWVIANIFRTNSVAGVEVPAAILYNSKSLHASIALTTQTAEPRTGSATLESINGQSESVNHVIDVDHVELDTISTIS